MKAIRLLFLLGLFGCTSFNSRAQTLIMNEVSNGTTGSQEYVEFVVVSDTVTYDCNSTTPPCIDIRGWIFDDNSGYHGSAGIASGAVRFSFDALWSCVPLGTIIVIYNDADPNTSLPANDLSLSDGNCTIIAPISNTSLFDKNTTTPGAAACSYPSTGWTAGGNWTNTALANSSDCARIVNLAGCEVFSVCYGSTDNQNTLIYFSPAGTGTTYYFNDTDPFSQSNWSSGSASTSQTPGAPNNAANAAYIAQYNNACNPITPLVVTPSSTNAGCSCDGAASASASGSIGPYSYLWSNGATTSSISALCAGTYSCTVTSHIGCTATITVTITATGTQPDASAGTPQTITCANSTAVLNGSSTAIGATYSWAGPGIVSGGSTTTPTVNAAGTYTLTVNSGGCSNTATVSVTSDTAIPNANIAVPSTLTCVTTTVTLNGSSTTSGVTFQWLAGGPATSSYNVFAPGTYSLVVTNPSNGCTNTVTTTVSSNTVSPTASIAAPGELNCIVSTVTLNGSSTTSGATFQWSGGPASANYSVSTIGVYTLTVTNPLNGCIKTATVSVNSNTTSPDVNIAPPAVITCTSPAVTLNGSSTVAGAIFQWSGGPSTANYTVTSPGTYTLVVGDPVNGCTNFTTTTVTSNQIFPNVSIAAPAQIKCNPSIVTLNGSSTTTGVTFQWTGGPATQNYTVNSTGIYTLTVTDPSTGCSSSTVTTVTTNTVIPDASIDPVAQLNCINTTVTMTGSSITSGVSYQWTSGPGAAAYTVSSPGTYTLSVTDTTNGCTNSLTATVISNLTPPNVSVANPDPLTCITTTVTLNGSSTTTNATYQWTSGPATANYDVTTAGNYTLTVTDPANGCVSNASVTVASNTTTPAISIDSAATLSCSVTSVTLSVSSTTAGAQFQWTSGPSAPAYIVSSPGTYTLTVTDPSNGCTNSGTVHVSQVGTFTAASTVLSNILCNGGSNGSIQVDVTGGEAPFVLLNSTTGSSISNISGFPLVINSLTANQYHFTISDNNGCVENTSATITQPSPLIVSITSVAAICVGDQAPLSAQVSGGTSPYSYNWSQGSATTASIVATPTVTTNYTVAITDANNCLANAQATLIVNPLPDADFIGVAQGGCADYCVNLVPDLPENPQWSYTWAFTDHGVVNDYNGNYCFTDGGVYGASLTVITDNNCAASFTVNEFITVFNKPGAAFVYNPYEISLLEPTVNFENLSVNATSYLWVFDDSIISTQTNPVITYGLEGEHPVTLIATNAEGCVDSISKIILVEGEYAVYVPNAFTPNGDGSNEFFRPNGVGVDDEHYEMMIFDRWGMLLYKTTDWEKGAWDGTFKGTIVQQDTYIYKIIVRPKDENLGSPKTLAGQVHVVR